MAVALKRKSRAVIPELLRDEDDIGSRRQRERRVGVATRMHHQPPDPLSPGEVVEPLPAPAKV